MSPAEILHRVGEARARKRLAALADGWRGIDAQRLTAVNLAPVSAALAAIDPRADRAVVSFLGRTWPRGSGPHGAFLGREWFYDPISQGYWPDAESSAFAVDVRSTSASPRPGRPRGDVKYVWEPNRLQMLHPLACRIAREGAYGSAWREAMDWIEHWMDANPPFRGVNWSSGIEIALRAVSVALVLAAAGPSGVPDRDCATIARFLTAHGRWLDALPSLYSSANNHRVAEGLGLLLCGLLLEGKEGYAADGRAILQQECLRQIFPDGVGVEQSPTYQAFTMELVGLGAVFATAAGQPFSAPALERLAAGVSFLTALLDDGGAAPAIGDDDEGRVITDPAAAEPLYVASVAAAIGALTGRIGRDAVRPGYLREGLCAAFASDVVEPVRRSAVKHFPDGGYTIAERDVGPHRARVIFDHGPLGFAPLAAHGHADALALWLSIDGRPVFIDAGTWLYHSGESGRDLLRGSAIHNTLTIAGVSQSAPSSAFSWSSTAQAAWLGSPPQAFDSDVICMAAGHDGYSRRFGVRHRRDIQITREDIEIADVLLGRGAEQEVAISFLCAPDIVVEPSAGGARLSRNDGNGPPLSLQLVAPAEFDVEIRCGDFENGRGLYSPAFGALAATSQIVLRGRMKPVENAPDCGARASRAVTKLAPSDGDGKVRA